MSFWSAFLIVLRWRPVDAAAALYWQLTRRKVRARHRLRSAAAKLPSAYLAWIRTIEQVEGLRTTVSEAVHSWRYQPLFSLILRTPGSSNNHELERTIRSIRDQLYPYWNLIILVPESHALVASRHADSRVRVMSTHADGPAGALANAIDECAGDYVLAIRAGDLLSEAALFRIGEALQTKSCAVVLYGDQDELDSRGQRTRPWFKPRWNAEMFLALDYLSAAAAIKTSVARRIVRNEVKDLTGLLLEATAEGEVLHVPHILCHVGARAQEEARFEVVSRFVKRFGGKAVPAAFCTVKVDWPLPSERPLVSIIIPSRDKVELLRTCIESVLNATTYQPFEIIIIDNGSREEAALTYLRKATDDPRVQVLRYEEPYNYSAINNFGARNANGEYLCLLNNDTEVVSDNWLTEMMQYAVQADTGAVGAKLLYPDGTIQHAGVIVGMGEAAGHAHRFAPSDEPGYFRQMHVAQFVSAVTGACLLVKKSKFYAVGGLDHEHLPIAYNDVDLCLKLQEAGWRNVYTPHAVLLHFESKSRGNDMSPEHIDRYMTELKVLQERWSTRTYDDPLHNPNLDRHSEAFVLRF